MGGLEDRRERRSLDQPVPVALHGNDVAGGWIFVSRLILEPVKRELQLKGAMAQEHFDCAALGLDWDALARRLSHEKINAGQPIPRAA